MNIPPTTSCTCLLHLATFKQVCTIGIPSKTHLHILIKWLLKRIILCCFLVAFSTLKHANHVCFRYCQFLQFSDSLFGKLLEQVVEYFTNWMSRAYFMPGHSDMLNDNGTPFTYLGLLASASKNVVVLDTVTVLENILFVPYQAQCQEDYLETLILNTCNDQVTMVCCCTAFEGTHLKWKKEQDKTGITFQSKDIAARFLILNGYYMFYGCQNNVFHIGAPYHTNRSQMKEPREIAIIDKGKRTRELHNIPQHVASPKVHVFKNTETYATSTIKPGDAVCTQYSCIKQPCRYLC